MQLLQSVVIVIVHFLFIICEHVETTITPQKTTVEMKTSTNETDEFKSDTRLPKCTTDKECSTHEWCKDAVCECEKGWIAWPRSGLCSYRQSSKIMSFVVSFIMGSVGVDWFVLSRKDSLYILCGILKLLLTTGCCIWNPLAARSKSKNAATAASCLSVTLTLISFIWWFVDWIRILLNSFPDGNGLPLV